MSDVNFVIPSSQNLSEEKLLDLVSENCNNLVMYDKKTRLILLKQIYTILGYTLDDDSILAILDESDVKLFIACAGAGKTTAILNNVIIEKIVRKSINHPGDRIAGMNMLCLVYNKANRKDVRNRHVAMINLLKNKSSGIDFLDNEMQVHTFHSFCLEWINPETGPYAEKCGLINYKLMNTDSEQQQQMKAAVSTIHRRTYAKWDEENVPLSSLLNLYNYLRENMLKLEDVTDSDKFLDIGLDLRTVKAILQLYDDLKLQFHQFDYSDVLIKFYNLIKTDKEAAARIRSCYEYIVADEIQDVTPLLMHILREISFGNTLVCVGDDDQCIYNFRGASSDNLLRFGEIFPEHKAFMLNTNRRCPSNITALASEVVGLISERFPKQIKSIKPNGDIEFISYRDTIGQYTSIVQKLSSMSEEDLSNTVVCYRNRSSSSLLVDMLAINSPNTPFHLISGNKPFSYKLYGVVFDVLNALLHPNNKYKLLNLFKAMPITKADWQQILGYNDRTKSFDNPRLSSLDDLDLGKYSGYQTFSVVWGELKRISANIEFLQLNKYFDTLLSYITSYYWNFVRDTVGYDVILDNEYKNLIRQFFSKPYSYSRFLSDFDLMKNKFERYRQIEKGVAFSTFHALKGLEFKYVFLIDLKEEIFPNLAGIQSKGYEKDVQTTLFDCETRLMYVALTRAKEKEYIYYSNQDPSIYVNHLLSTKTSAVLAQNYAEDVKNVDISQTFIKAEQDSKGDEVVETISEVPTTPITPVALNSESCDNIKILDKKIIKREATFRNPILARFMDGR